MLSFTSLTKRDSISEDPVVKSCNTMILFPDKITVSFNTNYIISYASLQVH